MLRERRVAVSLQRSVAVSRLASCEIAAAAVAADQPIAPIRRRRCARPRTHGGWPNSAAIGHSACAASSRQRYRFHQPLRSETKCSSPSGDHTRLLHRFAAAAGDAPRSAAGRRRRQSASHSSRTVPRHVGMVPGSARRAGVPSRAQARRGVEVAAVDAAPARRAHRRRRAGRRWCSPARRRRDGPRARTTAVRGGGSTQKSRVTQRGLGRDRRGAAAGVDAVNALVVETAEAERAASPAKAPPPYSCTRAAHVQRRRCQSSLTAVGAARHDHLAAVLARA